MHTITVSELREKQKAGENFTLIDVREAEELETLPLPGIDARHIPMNEVPAHLEELRAAKEAGPLYISCRSGGRSGKVCEGLHEQGIEAVNVIGGALAWNEMIQNT